MTNSASANLSGLNDKGNSRFLGICSGTKGSGKTCLAITLCHSLSLMKKKVLFFDADCGLENITAQLNLQQAANYTGLISGNLTLNNAVNRNNEGRFDIIAGFPGNNILATAPVGRLQILALDLCLLSKNYDFTIVDCTEERSNIFLSYCSEILVMLNADHSSVIGAYKRLENLRHINPHAYTGLVINRALSRNEGLQIYKTLLQAGREYIKLSPKLAGIIRQDGRIRDAVLNQSLLLSRYPASEGAEDMVMITRQLLENNHEF